MADMNSISHSVINVDDLHESARFYCDVLGGERRSSVCYETEDTLRGRSVHETYIVHDFVFFVALAEQPLVRPPTDQHRGFHGFRTGFFVSREKFDQTIESLRKHGVSFEGPVDHPIEGPLGQSVYFKDPAGNFLECSWRRDETSPAFKRPNFIGVG